MKREDLAEFSQREVRRQTRNVLFFLAFGFVWIFGLFTAIKTSFDWLDSKGLLLAVVIVGPGVLGVVAITMVMRSFQRLPRCPHCGIRLMRSLLSTAVATGNCGHCGKSIEG